MNNFILDFLFIWRYYIYMNSKLIVFRCPVTLLEKLDQLADVTQSNRTAVLIEAVRIFSRQVHKRGGQVVPPYKKSAMPKKLNFNRRRS